MNLAKDVFFFNLVQLAMLLWSYFSVVFTDPGVVPPNWRPSTDEERGESDPLNSLEFVGLQPDSSNPRVRFCRKCNQLKPSRCHHCSVCKFLQILLSLPYIERVLKLNCCEGHSIQVVVVC